MKRKIVLILVTAVFLTLSLPIVSFCQEQAAESEIQWIWGEAISIDIPKNELLIQYLDYDTDEDRQISISVDDKTSFENASSLLDIKPHEVVIVDFLAYPDGKNIAKNINVEKPEIESAAKQAIP